MVNPRRLSLAFILLVSLHAAFATADCGELLAPPARGVLRQLVAENSDVSLFTKQVDEQTKLIVLVGESSLKSPEGRILTQDLNQYFRWQGYESLESSPTWGSKLDEKLLQPLRARFHMPDAFERIVLQKIDQARTNGATEFSLADLETALKVHQTKRFVKKRLKQLEAMPPGTLDDVIRPGTIAPTRRDQIEFLRAFLRDDHDPDHLNLSQGHVPEIWENLHSVSSLSVMGIYFAAELTTYLMGLHSMTVSFLNSAAVTSYFALGIANRYRTNSSQSVLSRVLFPIQNGDLISQDKTLSQNAIQALEQPEIDVLLIKLRKAHVPGISRHFKSSGLIQETL